MATQSFTLTGDPADIAELGLLNAQFYGYQETIDGEPNPETRQEFLRKKIRDQFIMQANLQKKLNARVAAEENIEPLGDIT